MKQKEWSVSDISNPEPWPYNCLPMIEFKDNKGEWHDFHLVITKERVVFGGACNVGLLESGYIEREEGEDLYDTLRELTEDLEVYYNDGPGHTSRIVCNERM